MKKKLKNLKHKRWLVFFLLIALPFLALSLSGSYEWRVRLFFITMIYLIGAPAWFWWILNPRTHIISKEAKLNQPKYDKVRPRWNLIIRTVFFLAGVCAVRAKVIPLISGLAVLHKGQSVQYAVGKVCSANSTFPLFQPFFQSIVIEIDGVKKSYHFDLSFQPRLHEDQKYEFIILPNSEIILEVRKIDGETGSLSQFSGN